MTDEIEAIFLDVDIDEVRDKLKALGATCKLPMSDMKRTLFDYPDRRLMREQNSWIRIRDEGDHVSLTFKHLEEGNLHGAKEIETTVGSYEGTVAIFDAIGMFKFSEQETKRETWTCGDCLVMIDQWPWINPYIEIEGPSEAAIRKLAKEMDYGWKTAVFGSVASVYRMKYPDILPEEKISSIAEVKFSLPPPDWFVKTK
jgi:adenylate cyclase class 2